MIPLFKTGKPNKAELTNLAALHHEALASSRIADLGLTFVKNFYFHASKRREVLLYWVLDSSAAHQSERVVGLALMVTRSPKSVLAMLAATHPFVIGFPMFLYLWRNRQPIIVSNTDEARNSRDFSLPILATMPSFPELLYLAIAKRGRSQGLGQALIDVIIHDFASYGFSHIAVRTATDPQITASRFYQKNGFVPYGILAEQGKSFLVLTRTIS